MVRITKIVLNIKIPFCALLSSFSPFIFCIASMEMPNMAIAKQITMQAQMICGIKRAGFFCKKKHYFQDI